MLTSLRSLQGYSLRTADAKIGSISEVYFDDEAWMVRHLAVRRGWWRGSRVFIPSGAVDVVDPERHSIDVALTTDQVLAGHRVDQRVPVSPQRESQPCLDDSLYRIGPPVSRHAPSVGTFADGSLATLRAIAEAEGLSRGRAPSAQVWIMAPIVYSSKEVIGYHILAADGEIGHVDDFIVDDETWSIRFVQIDTSNWIGGETVLVPRAALRGVNSAERQLQVAFHREQVRSALPYDPRKGL